VKHASESDRTAHFEDLFRRTRVDLLRYLTRRSGSPEEAADLLAETYLIAWRRFEAIPAGEQARLWLFGAARNLLRKGASRRRTADLLNERLAGELSAAQQLAEATSEDRSQFVLKALAELGEQDREILTLVAWEGLQPREIACVMDMSANRVRVRLHRARAKLRRQLRPARPGADHPLAIVAARED
jgi:RNA polymerase sigma-70 factor (ECF subfamily)